MSSSDPRIVAVTDSPALVIGLTCLPRDWDVVCHPTNVDAGIRSEAVDVLVLDLGSTTAGLALLDSLAGEVAGAATGEGGERLLRAIVLGDEAPAGSVPAETTWLLRPYTLPQLEQAIQERLQSSAETTAPPQPVAAVDPSPDEAAAVTAGDEMEAAVLDHAARPGHELAQQEDDVTSDESIIDLTRIPEAPPPTRSRAQRWLARRSRPSQDVSGQLRDRLAAVLEATAELERIVEDFPLLCSVGGFAEAVVADVAAQLDATTAGLWRMGPEGWTVIAHHGMTAQEASWQVPLDHPLFSEVDLSGGALLLDPVDAMQAAVAGIGGAHTESFMAAAIAAGPHRFGILAVGRDRPLVERDLDALVDLASEAGPGIAAAEQLARFRALTDERTPEVVER